MSAPLGQDQWSQATTANVKSGHYFRLLRNPDKEPFMPGRDEVARKLAAAHFSLEPGIVRIFQLREESEAEDASTQIKLLEVNETTSPSGVMPLYFRASPESGYPYPSVIVEVTPDEFEQIRSNILPLPAGWLIAEELPREAG